MSLTLITTLFFLIGLAQCHAQKLKFCTVEKNLPLCLQMAEEHNDLVECVSRIDGLSCMEAIAANEADIMNLDAANIFVAGNNFNLSVLAFEQNNGEPYKYRSVALVRKSLELSSLNDLKGKKSCHTGVGRTAGWQIPIAQLSLKGIMTPDCRGELETVENFFNQSCAPGSWSNDPIVDAELKKHHPSLCSLCENPERCLRSDRYSGYEGALRCLHDGRGDIAFSKTEAVEKYALDNPTFADDHEYLCVDNTRKSLSEGADILCSWGIRPSNAFVVCSHRTAEEKEHYYSVLKQLFAQYSLNIPQIQNQERPAWFTKFFVSSVNVTDILRATPEKEEPLIYLGRFSYTMNRKFGGCTPRTVRFCTTSEPGLRKCADLDKMVISRRIYAKVECVLEPSTADCITAVKEGRADLITLDGGDVYRAGRYSGLVPITAEMYGKHEDSTYLAVAVISSNSEINGLEDLRGLKSCHTGMGRTAGWVMPVGFLASEGLISKDQCDKAAAIADLFSASCVPGANNPKYNPSGSGAVKLCQQCIGDVNGENKCARGSAERYSGYAGALRCLVENSGDIAFVKHTTVPEYTDNNSELDWAKDLKSENFKLLCRNGSSSTIENYENCNLGRVPSHSVMISGSATFEERLWLSEFIAALNKWFGISSTNFVLFKPYEGKADLLFKDSTTYMKAYFFDSTYKDVLGKDYLNAVESTDPTLCVQES